MKKVTVVQALCNSHRIMITLEDVCNLTDQNPLVLRRNVHVLLWTYNCCVLLMVLVTYRLFFIHDTNVMLDMIITEDMAEVMFQLKLNMN